MITVIKCLLLNLAINKYLIIVVKDCQRSGPLESI